ncbi:BREX-1 system adenine-specific DNA-methyltransferase PglX [Hymenobacter sp. 5414T-23]|uniref:BREX-1 system adenine-specific DNA-methyltransferase PglX n=1 Tax=Hymenobacter sp. 5414T-23 TaxID=2932252 RepID=UPI001FD43011|nr:BREX-1 system adenine-specific DNA-methyltransferase PglX [Hymenobacter sp. 5414T-23]UOQ83255.1 BREX-1 system adenine-specific DNA-methyltransferase PglX [Hymenobacter sp. 5414T-23]
MNTNKLKKFAQDARKKLMEQVAAKLEYVLTTDTAALRERASQVSALREELSRTTKQQLVEKVAYTWFNRLVTLRFMDVNDYQPLDLRVLTPKEGYTLPELLDDAKTGHVAEELKVNNQLVFDLLDGRMPSANPQNEAYRVLLIGACNYLHTLLPFLFERINDYTELLLPDDLTSDFSVVHDVRVGMAAEDCQQVEIIGWLYQFYISEKKDEVFASKTKVKKEDIPAATQLFTPRWIVEYMVQNTVGKLWLQNRPNSSLREHMPYFIESASLQSEDYLKLSSQKN